MKYIAMLKEDNREILNGNQCVTSLKDLYRVILYPECNELYLRKEFTDTYFTYRGVCDFIQSVQQMFGSSLKIEAEDELFTSKDDAARTLMGIDSVEEFIYDLTRSPDRVMNAIRDMCKYYFKTQVDSSVASNKLATMYRNVQSLQRDLDMSVVQHNMLMAHNNDLRQKLEVLSNRVNYTYKRVTDTDTMFHLEENMFIKVLYIKEHQYVKYTNSLVYYLSEILKTLYSEPVRTVIIDPYYSYQESAVQNPNFAPHWDLTYSDVSSGNIVMAGFQPHLMEDILKNASHIHYLIILDRSGCNQQFVDGYNVETYHVGPAKYCPIGTEPNRIISDSDDTLSVPYVPDYTDLTPNERIQTWSDFDVVTQMIDTIEEK